MNVLGVIFYSKLTWSNQVTQATQKSKKALHAINLIKIYFTPQELLTLITSNYLSILFYNADVWLLPSLAPNLKKQLMAASAAPLKFCTHLYDRTMSYETLHSLNNRVTPN